MPQRPVPARVPMSGAPHPTRGAGARRWRGAALVALGLGALGVTLAGVVQLSVPAFVLVAGGVVLLVVDGRRAVAPGSAARDPDSDEAVTAVRATRVAAALSAAEGPMRLGQLVTALGWSEEAVVDGLNHLVEGGRADEELDLDSGEWWYRLQVADPLLTQALSISERARGRKE